MRDNQPKHRQARKDERRLTRQKASREGLPAILIVCEGKETEPNYLHGLCEARRINIANVKIESGGNATDAVSLIKRAQSLFAKDKDYDQVFVVLDDDGQPLEVATRLAQKPLRTVSGKVIHVELIVSRPSFEYWLLLHLEYSARPFGTAVEVVDALRAHLTNYDKADRQIFQQVEAGLDLAVDRALRLKRELATSGARSPDADMHKLVAQLLSMRRSD